MAREQILQGLLQRGFPAHVAQGIVGNIAVESGFNPGINEIAPLVPGSRGGFGLFQHTGPRRRALEAFASQTGRPLADIDTQLDFVVQELGTTEKAAADALKGAKTTEEAARIFSEKFLRPGIPHLDRRIAAATGAESVAADTMSALGKSPQMTLLGSEGNDNMAEQPQGLLGGTKLGNFLTPDRRDHLIAALEGMTLNPNQALIQAAGGRIQKRQQDRAQAEQANKTAEFLRQRGRDDLAAAVKSGSIDPRAAVQAALTPAADDRTALIKNFEFARQSGFEGTFEDYLKLTKTGTTVNVGDGQPRVGTIPQGFQLIDDGQGGFRMSPIPGGPADTSEVEKKAETQKGVQRSIVDDQIDTAFSIMEKKGPLDLPEAGIIGSALGSLGINQEAVDLKNTLASIQGSVAFDTLQKMREASKTGGALGGVSERELDLLISTMGALQQDTSPDLLKRNLNTIRRIMGKITNDPVASRFLNGSPSGEITTTTLPPADDGGFVIKRSF